MTVLATTLAEYRMNVGLLPDVQGGESIVDKLRPLKGYPAHWLDRYTCQKAGKWEYADAWGRTIYYQVVDPGGTFLLSSAGPDGIVGTGDDVLKHVALGPFEGEIVLSGVTSTVSFSLTQMGPSSEQEGDLTFTVGGNDQLLVIRARPAGSLVGIGRRTWDELGVLRHMPTGGETQSFQLPINDCKGHVFGLRMPGVGLPIVRIRSVEFAEDPESENRVSRRLRLEWRYIPNR